MLAGDDTPGPSYWARRSPSVGRRVLRMMARRRRTPLVALCSDLDSCPGLARSRFRGDDGAGLSTDLANGSVLASGMIYVVQPGDTVSSIARMVNPVDPHSLVGPRA